MKWITLLSAFLLGACASQPYPISEFSPSITFPKIHAPLVNSSLALEGTLDVPIHAPSLPIRPLFSGEEYPTFLCGGVRMAKNNSPIKYTLKYSGKLSGHTIFSPYAEFTEGDYWQVIFHD